MLNFDQTLFYNTYNSLLAEKTFKEIFYEIFIPILDELGILWQTNTITPAHEHFLSIHFKQKILLNIEKLQSLEPNPNTKTFVLFLPENEIHDIGLLFINYELLSKGYHTIFLGESVPVESLKDLLNFFDNITFVSYFTVKPEITELQNYIKHIHTNIIKSTSNEFKILGQKLKEADMSKLPKQITTYTSIKDLVKEL